MLDVMATRAVVKMAYVGAAVEDHTMDVRDLAPALLSMGELLQEANQVVNGDDSKVCVRVIADPEGGSFKVCFEVLQSILDAAKGVLSLGGNHSAKEILEMLGIIPAAGGLVYAIKRIAGRDVEQITVRGDGSSEIKVVGDGNTIIVAPNVGKLYQTTAILSAANDVVKPLDVDGIDRVTFSNANGESEVIEKDERPYFEVRDSDSRNVMDRTVEFAYEIIGPAFDEKFKWRLSDGVNASILARMKDESFLDDVGHGRTAFSKGDTILAKVRITQTTGQRGLQTQYEIVKVLEHRRARNPSTALLPFPEIED